MKTRRLLPVPGTPIGYLSSGKPVYPVIGASEDLEIESDEGEAEEEESDEESEDDKDAKDEKYTPPSREEWVKVQAALVKSNAQAKQRREALAAKDKELQKLQDEKAAREAEAERRELLEGVRGKKKAAADGGGGAPTPVLPEGVLTKAQVKQLTAQVAREAEERAADKYRGQIASAAAREALVGAGAQTSNVSRLVRLLDLDEVQIGDEGEVTEGLDEQVEKLKAELPQLFKVAEPEKPKPRRQPAPKIQPAGRQDAEEVPSRTADRMAAAILGTRA